MELSVESMNKASKLLRDFENKYRQGIKNSIKTATEGMYNKVLAYCYENDIKNHTDAIHWEYDEEKNVGRVWTNDWVIIFNEMGTGVVGSNNPHPNPNPAFKGWKYDINDHGEKGWYYPKSDGTLGWTKGLPSRHMFYSAFEDIKDELGDYVQVELMKTVGTMYRGD